MFTAGLCTCMCVSTRGEGFQANWKRPRQGHYSERAHREPRPRLRRGSLPWTKTCNWSSRSPASQTGPPIVGEGDAALYAPRLHPPATITTTNRQPRLRRAHRLETNRSDWTMSVHFCERRRTSGHPYTPGEPLPVWTLSLNSCAGFLIIFNNFFYFLLLQLFCCRIKPK